VYIRFLASQGVVVGHALGFMNITPTCLRGMASYCVLIFFVLSGFLISYSLWYKSRTLPNYTFWSFFKDRFFRIYPPFIGSLLLVVVLDFSVIAITGVDFSLWMYLKNFVTNIFQLQGFPIANILYHQYGMEFFYFRHFGSNFPLWTISVEWWLYMFYGFLSFYVLRRPTWSFGRVFLFIFLLITPVYYIFYSTRLEEGLTLYWFLGALITVGLMQQPKDELNQRNVFTFSLSLVCLGLVGFSFLGYDVSILIFFLGLFLLIAFSREEVKLVQKWFQRPAKVLASYAYSLYLVHYPIMVFCIAVFKLGGSFGNFLLLVIVSNVIAFLFARIFENRRTYLKLYENYRRVKD